MSQKSECIYNNCTELQPLLYTVHCTWNTSHVCHPIASNITMMMIDEDLWQCVAVDMNVFHGDVHQTPRGGATDSQDLVDCRLC